MSTSTQTVPMLLPNRTEVPRRVFKNGSELARFRQSFHEEIRPEMEQLKKARQESEQDAKSHWVR